MKVRCKVVLDIETEFDDAESTADTLLYCLQEDINDMRVFEIHSAEVISEHELLKRDDISDYRCHMPIHEFREYVLCGAFTSYDGFGYYATDSRESGVPVSFKLATLDAVIAEGIFTHVMWFNK